MLEQSERQALTKAFCQLRGWLQSSRIPIKTDGYKITAKSKSGSEIPLTISNVAQDFDVDMGMLNHKKLDIAISEFHRITDKLGYGRPEPLQRGTYNKRASYRTDFDLVAMRHREFRRVANPTADQLAKYRKTQEWSLALFLRKRFKQLETLGLSKDDVETYIQIWTCNYIGLYEVQGPNTDEENEKRLYAYLKQRLHGLIDLAKKKYKNCNDQELVVVRS